MSKDIYRSRLSKSLSERARKYLSSIKEDAEFFNEEIQTQIAHVAMLQRIGIFEKEEAKRIVDALMAISKEELISSTFEDIHEFIEAKLIEKLGEVAMKIQTGRSRNDQVATITRLKLKNLLLKSLEAEIKFVKDLLDRAEKDIECLIIYRTHRRDAQVANLSHYWLAFVDSSMRNLERIIEAYHRCDLSPLGASACGGSLIPLDREFTKEMLGFSGLIENSLDAVTTRDFILDSLHALTCIMVDLSRMAEDLIYWTDMKILDIDDSHASTSSLMPHKKNPDVLEMIKARAKEVISGYGTVSNILSSLPSGYNRELQRVKAIVIEKTKLAIESIEMMAEVVHLIKYDKNKAEEAILRSESIATDIAEYLVLNTKIPFREIHKGVANIFRELSNKKEIMDRISSYFKIESLEKLEPKLLLSLRKSLGSPNPSEIKRMLSDRKDKIVYFEDFLEKHKKVVKEVT